MLYLYIVTALALLISLIADKNKTLRALKSAFRKLMKILPAFVTMLIFVSIVLYLVPDRVILNYLGNDDMFTSLALASFFGSITILPGFIAFPLAGILLEKGVSYTVLAAFTTTLMMVGILSFPVEKEYFGCKVGLLRNAVSLLIALITAVTIGCFFGELL